MIIEQEIKLDYKDVLFRPKRSTLESRKDVDLTREFVFRNSKQTWKWVPIVAANMDTIGTFEMAKALYQQDMMTCLHKFYSVDQIVAESVHDYFQNVAVSIGILEDDLFKFDEIMSKTDKVRRVCIDVANWYTQRFISTIEKIRIKYPKLIIIAGNVVTKEITEELILKWADIVKVGIWPWSVCTTRIQTWVWYPQLSAVIECADAAHGIWWHVMADWWCTNPGDVSKAYGWWGDFVMLGGMLAWHDECNSKLVEKDGKKYMEYYGMSSDIAMSKHYGGVAEYRSSEWKYIQVPYKWPVRDTIQSILGWVRSTCTYIWAVKLKYLPKCTTFIRCTMQSNEVWSSNNKLKS